MKKPIPKPKIKESTIIHVAIECGACGQTHNHGGSLEITAGQCGCHPDTYTCMCDLSKKLDFQCPSCKYFGTIEIL